MPNYHPNQNVNIDSYYSPHMTTSYQQSPYIQNSIDLSHKGEIYIYIYIAWLMRFKFDYQFDQV